MPKGGASKVSCPEGYQSPEVLAGQPLCSTPKIWALTSKIKSAEAGSSLIPLKDLQATSLLSANV